MLPEVTEFVVQGITVEGELFQPPDWPQKLCNKLAATDPEGRFLFSSYVHPTEIEGVASVIVRAVLQQVNEKAFEIIKQFVIEHRLQVRAGRGCRDAEITGKHPAFVSERRLPENNNW